MLQFYISSTSTLLAGYVRGAYLLGFSFGKSRAPAGFRANPFQSKKILSGNLGEAGKHLQEAHYDHLLRHLRTPAGPPTRRSPPRSRPRSSPRSPPCSPPRTTPRTTPNPACRAVHQVRSS